MALLNWLDDGSNHDQQDNQPTPAIKQVASVQSSWQPTQTGTSSTDSTSTGTTPDNYLLSDQHAQADSDVAAQRAAEEAARQQAAAAAEAARQANAAAAANAAAQQTTQTQEAVPAQTKYGGGQKKNEGGFTGFLKDVGSGVEQGLGAIGDVAVQAGGVLGSIGKNGQDLVNHMAQVEKVRNWLHGGQDFNGNNLTGTQDVDQAGANIAAGRGSAQDFAAVGGKGLQIGIDATQFLNPARMAVSALPEVERSASMLSHLTPVVQNAARDAAFYGGTQGVATTAQQYGQNGDIIKALEDGGRDALIGGALQGGLDLGGHAVGAGISHGVKTLTPVAQDILSRIHPGELTPALDHAGEIVNGGVQTAEQRLNSVEEGLQKPGQNDQNQPHDGNVAFDQAGTPQPDGTRLITLNDTIPITDHYTPPEAPAPVADGLSSLSHDPTAAPAPDAPMPLNELSQRATAADPSVPLTPETAPTPVKEPVPTAMPAQVADGTVLPSKVMPAADPKMPMVKSEQVSALNDAKAGASQADEAALNQQLQQAHNEMPVIHDPHTPEGIAGITPHDNAETSLNKIDQALENGHITPDEHAAIENHIFNQENQAGRMVAEDGSSLPDGMSGDKPVGPNAPITKSDIADRIITNVDHAGDIKEHVASSLGIPLDSGLDMKGMLEDSGVNQRSADKINQAFDRLQKSDATYNKIQEASRQSYTAGEQLPTDISKERNHALSEALTSMSDVIHETRFAAKSGSISERVVQALEDAVKYRAVNTLTSLGLFERNAAQEIVSAAFRTAQNPIKAIQGAIGYGNPLVSATKSAFRDVTNTPTGVLEKAKHVSTSVYKVGMIPTEAIQSSRVGMYRDEIARQALKLGGNDHPSILDIRDLAKRGGGLMESVAQMYAGVDSQIIPRKQALQAGDALMKFLKTGTDSDYKAVSRAIQGASGVANGIVKNLEISGKLDGKVGRVLTAAFNGVFMYSRTALNSMRNSAEIMNPFSMSLVDSIGRTNRSTAGNVLARAKALPAKAAILGAVPALYAVGQMGYNDGDQPDKPTGVWIRMPNGSYITSRTLGPLELPVGIMVAGSELYHDAQKGSMRDAGHYSGILTQSLPYVDTANQVSGAVDSLWTMLSDTLSGNTSGTGDSGYAAKSYGINMAKSFVPFSNNSVQPVVDGLQGKSTDARSSYAMTPVVQKDGTTKNEADIPTWFGNTVRKSFDPAFNNSLPISRDAAGRARTADNQGVFINKTINDANTKTYNDTINNLVAYGQQNGLGKSTADMFDSFNQGKNNNFRSAQGAISFLDVPQGSSPSNADKLKANPKLTDLSKQIHDGFFGDTGSNLLTLDGKDLKSDASVPGKSGSKNSNLPMSMQSIKNAIAQTDLPKAATDQLYQFSQQKTDLYNQLHNKQINYNQYSAAKSQIDQQEGSILTASPAYQKFDGLMHQLDSTGFFKDGGLGSTKSGQTFLWNSLNTMLGDKGATPAAEYPTTGGSGFKPFNFNHGTGRTSNAGGKNPGQDGVKWTPAGKGQMASVSAGKYTPVNIKVNLGNAVKKDKTQNYAATSF